MFSVFFYKLPTPFIYIMIPKNGWYKLLIININIMKRPVTNQITINEKTVQNDNPIISMFDKPFYTNKEVMKMLDCTEKTLRKYRNDGFLGYSRMGDKYFYTVNDILMFLKYTHVDPYQYS